MKLVLVLLAILTAVAPAFAGADDIVGVWFNEEKDAKIQLFQCGGKYCGKIVWLNEPNYSPGSKEGTPGTPQLDDKNPDKARRSTPVMGLQIATGFDYAGNNLWNDGKIYDPKSGKTYSAKMTLVSPAQLNIRGYVGISLIGRTTVWTRAQSNRP